MFLTFFSVIMHAFFYVILGKESSCCNKDSTAVKRENAKGQWSIGPVFSSEKNRQCILLARLELSVPGVKHNAKEEYPRGTNLNGRQGMTRTNRLNDP